MDKFLLGKVITGVLILSVIAGCRIHSEQVNSVSDSSYQKFKRDEKLIDKDQFTSAKAVLLGGLKWVI